MILRMVYDLGSQPFSVGDVLVFHALSLCLAKERGYESVDFVITHCPNRAKMNGPAFSDHSNNFAEDVKVLAQLSGVNPLCSPTQVLTHVQCGALPHHGYEWWPQAIGGPYHFYESVKLIRAHYDKFGSVPYLRSSDATLKWAREFGGDFVSVQLRRTSRGDRSSQRNSDYRAWDWMLRRIDDKFIVIGKRNEVDPKLRSPNVVFSKDHNTTLSQDLALMQVAKFHMGASSGPGVVALFGDRPYRLYNPGNVMSRQADWFQSGRFVFSKENQIMRGVETKELLMSDYDEMNEMVTA